MSGVRCQVSGVTYGKHLLCSRSLYVIDVQFQDMETTLNSCPDHDEYNGSSGSVDLLHVEVTIRPYMVAVRCNEGLKCRMFSNVLCIFVNWQLFISLITAVCNEGWTVVRKTFYAKLECLSTESNQSIWPDRPIMFNLLHGDWPSFD